MYDRLPQSRAEQYTQNRGQYPQNHVLRDQYPQKTGQYQQNSDIYSSRGQLGLGARDVRPVDVRPELYQGGVTNPAHRRDSNTSTSSRGSGVYATRPYSDHALSSHAQGHHTLPQSANPSPRNSQADIYAGGSNRNSQEIQKKKYASSADIYKMLDSNRKNPFVRSDQY